MSLLCARLCFCLAFNQNALDGRPPSGQEESDTGEIENTAFRAAYDRNNFDLTYKLNGERREGVKSMLEKPPLSLRQHSTVCVDRSQRIASDWPQLLMFALGPLLLLELEEPEFAGTLGQPFIAGLLAQMVAP